MSLPETPTNIMSVTTFVSTDAEKWKDTFQKFVSKHPKTRSQIVEVLGDLYYRESLSVEEACNSQLRVLPAASFKT